MRPLFASEPATGTEVRGPGAWGPLLAAGGATILAVALLAAARSQGVAPRRLLQDPAGQYDMPPYIGVLSHAGVGLLVATAAITGFVAVLGRREMLLLWLVAGLSMALAADDLLMLHERVVPQVLGLDERVPQALYGLVAVLILVRLWRAPGAAVVLIPLGLLAASVGADQMDLPMNTRVLVEDLTKLAGFAAWLAFWAAFAAARMREAGASARRTARAGPQPGAAPWPTR